jgi:uncharacterized Fe-S cluster-containing radical SAM superfamily protein
MASQSPLYTVSAFPSMLVVSLTNVCDYACVHCFHRIYSRQPGYQRQYMPKAIFRRIVAELKEHPATSLRLIAWGEPLLHADVVEFVRLTRQSALENPITLITNGYHLTPELSLALMQAGLDLIEVSLDAVTAESYRRVRVAPDSNAFGVVTANLQAMLQQRNEGGYETRIAVSYIVWPAETSQADYQLFEKQWSGAADEVIRRRLHTFKGAVPTRIPLPEQRGPCRGLWARCNINPWGQISVCYNDWENANVLGDLRLPNTTIAEVWQGNELNSLRTDQCQGVFRGICAQCRDYNPTAWEHPYEEVIARCKCK